MTGDTTSTATTLDATRWQGFSHDELYQMLHDGPGATASALPVQRWTEITSTLADVDTDLHNALTRSSGAWQGTAATTAYQRLSTLADWATTGTTTAGVMRDGTQQQAENIAKARADMPAPTKVPPASPDPTVLPATQVLTMQNDLEQPDAAAAAGEQTAHDVMSAYELSTEQNVQRLTGFTEPEQVSSVQGLVRGTGTGVRSSVTGQLVGGHGVTGAVDDTVHASSVGVGTAHPTQWLGSDPANGGGGGIGGGGSSVGAAGSNWVDPGVRAPRPLPGIGTYTTASPYEVGAVGPGGLTMSPGQSSSEQRRGGIGQGARFGSTPISPVSGGSAQSGSSFASTPNSIAGSTTGGPNGGPSVTDMPPPVAPGTMGAGTPVSPAGAMGAGDEKLAGRRMAGGDLGSAQWGESEPGVPSATRGDGNRRRDLRQPVRVTETVSVNGEDIELPEQVIGDGPSRS